MLHNLDDGLQVGWTVIHPDVVGEFGFDGELMGVYLVCFQSVGIEVKHEAGTEAQCIGCGGDAAHRVLASRADDGCVVCLDATQEFSSV